MRKLALFIYFIPLFVSSQIKIDLGEKSANELNTNLYFTNENVPPNGYYFSKAYDNFTGENRYSKENTKLFSIGCPILITYKKQTKLITANYSGDIFFYDLFSGRLEKQFSFSILGNSMLNTSGSNRS